MTSTYEKMIEISIQNFSKGGYYGTSLKKIAEDLGIKKPSLYNYIENKDYLYELCLKKCTEERLKIIEEINIKAEDIEDELISFFIKFLYKSKFSTYFYIQLSTAPKNLSNTINQNNNILSRALIIKLNQIYEHINLKIPKDEFILLVKMYVDSWMYSQIFKESGKIQEDEIKNESKILLNKILK